jgi:predicted DCC family thiol-disulfide oxidoreductase YuxK
VQATNGSPGVPVVLYDADCGFCTWVVDRLAGRVAPGSIEIVPLQGARADELLRDRVDETARWESWHLIEVDGSLYSGGDAVPRALRHVRGGRIAGRIAARLPRTTAVAYGLVARNRNRLGRVVRADRCRVPGTRR